MASIDKISRAYRGQLAAKYDKVRDKQARWHDENRVVEGMLEVGAPGKRGKQSKLLDMPVGTGRFLEAYRRLGYRPTGVDSSEEMLEQAQRKGPWGGGLLVGDARHLEFLDKTFDVSVCVRFLNLIEEEALREVMRELDRVTRRMIVLTIRLGEEYHSGSSMATHDDKRFRALVRRLGWQFGAEVPWRAQGWLITRLDRR